MTPHVYFEVEKEKIWITVDIWAGKKKGRYAMNPNQLKNE